nr:hypothetical protein [Tanacetum cinerariifolium]
MLLGILTTARRKLMLLRINLQLLVIVTVVEIKTVNDDVHLQALIDGKKVVITEASIRHDLKLNDAEGTLCLPNVVIFEELARMGYEKPSKKVTFYKAFFSPQWKFFIHSILQCLSAKTTSWNEFSSTMASTIICLAINQKFNFSKYILDNLKKNLEAGVPFYMFPRLTSESASISVIFLPCLDDFFLSTTVSLKQEIQPWNRFFGAVIPLFGTMIVQAVKKVGDLPTAVQDTLILDAPSSSQPQRKYKPRMKERKETKVSPIKLHTEDHVPTTSNDPLPSVIEEMVEVITTAKIIVDEVSTAGGELNAANEEPDSVAPTNITTAQPSEATKTTVDITTAPKAKGIVFYDMEESTTRTASLKSQVKDKGKAKLVEEPKVLKSRKAQTVQSRQSDAVRKYQALKRKHVSVAQARKNMMIYLKNMAGFKMEFVSPSFI